jgi:hypothetical protein
LGGRKDSGYVIANPLIIKKFIDIYLAGLFVVISHGTRKILWPVNVVSWEFRSWILKVREANYPKNYGMTW